MNHTFNLNIVDSIYIATSLTNAADSALFFRYNYITKENRNIGYIPSFNIITDPEFSLDIRTIYTNNIRISQEHNSIIVGFKYFNLINFYTLNGDLKKSYSIKGLIEPIDSRKIDVSENTIVTFYYMYATSNFCYLLWKGEPIEMADSKVHAKLFVFDWEGNLYQTYELANKPLFIVVDERSHRMLGGVFSEKNEFVEIHQYDLL